MPTLSKNYLEAGQQISRDNDKWGPDPLGTSATVTYGFRPTGASIPVYTLGTSELTGTFQEFTINQKVQALAALTQWSDLANINFVFAEPGSGPLPDNPDIFMATYFDSDDKKGGFAIGPDEAFYAGDIWLDRSVEGSSPPRTRVDVEMATGTRFYQSLVHEIGHSIGLQHPGDYDASDGDAPTYATSAEYIEDTQQFTLLSYFDEANSNGGTGNAGFATTPLLHDIAAIQRLYGANWSTRSSTNTYGFNSNAGPGYNIIDANDKRSFAIWDGGGVDTLDFSGYGDSQYITLVAAIANQASAEVKFSSVGGNIKNVVIAPGVVIENAIGGSGSDNIIGNQVANILDGRGGIDTMAGSQGADTYYVDNESDYVNDALAIAVDDGAIDQIYATCSYSLVNTFAENLYLNVTLGDFDLTGNASVNFLDGNDGANIFRGNGGGDSSVRGSGDFMRGRGGNDTYFANFQDVVQEVDNGGYDTIYANKFTLDAGASIEVLESLVKQGPGVNFIGNEVGTLFYGTTGYDNIDGGAGNDTIVGNYASLASTTGNLLRGGDGLDNIIGDNGEDSISGGADADTIDARGGNDSISGGSGGDTIDGGLGTDLLSYDGSSTGVIAALQSWSFRTNNILLFSSVAAGFRNGDAQGDIVSGIENLAGSANPDSLVGDGGINKLFGDRGNDRLAGADGNDFLYGEDGNDRLEGGLGNDELYGDVAWGAPYGTPGDFAPGNDVLLGDEGNDRLQGGQGADSIYGGDGNDILIGNEFAGDLNNPYTFASDLSSSVGLQGFGLDDSDVDILSGGAGNDIYYLGGKEDTISEAINGGIDELRLALHDESFDLSAAGYENIENMTYLTSFHYVVNLNPNPFDPLLRNLISGTADFTGIGNALANKITGADMWDTLNGLGGNDTLIGLAGVDTLNGGLGDDTLIGGVDGDTLNGGDNSDTVSYATSAGAVEASFSNITKILFGNLFTILTAGFRGNDAEGDIVSSCENITGSAFADKLGGNADANTLIGGNGNDALYSGLGADLLYGGGDNDSLVGGLGADTMYGGSGNDTYEVDDAGDIASEQSSLFNFFFDDGGFDTVNTTLNSYALYSYIETLNFNGIGNFVGTGNDGDNAINGGTGNDTIQGGKGADNLFGGSNGVVGDTLSYVTSVLGVSINLLTNTAQGGDAQGDIISNFENVTGSAQGDQLIGDGNANVLTGGTGNDLFVGGLGADTMIGGADLDVVDYTSFATGVAVDLTLGTGPGGDLISEIENITGSAFGDVLIGDNGANTMRGGVGNDFFVAGNGADLLIGGADNDEVSYETATTGVFVNLITGTGANGGVLQQIENIRGSAFGDVLQGDNGANTIRGLAGNDYIIAGNGADLIIGGADNDTVSYETATAGIFANLATGVGANGGVLQEIENLTGSNFGDVLIGSALGNTLKGGNGNDYLVGNEGSDALYGGADNDTFRFETTTFGNDVIADFQDNGDKLSFASAVATNFNQFTILNNNTTNVTVQIAGQSIVVQGVANISLTAGDFLFV